jgi:signal transduction histidine kinase
MTRETPSNVRALARLGLAGGAVLVLFFAGYELLERALLAGRVSQATLGNLHLLRGVVAALLLFAVATLQMLRLQREQGRVAIRALVDRGGRQRQYLEWFVGVRWVAVGFAGATVVIVAPVARIVPLASLPLALGWCALLGLANVAFARLLRRDVDFERQALLQITVDLVALTGLLNATGGLENPLYTLYLFHVFIAGILLSPRRLAAVTALAAGLVTALALGELWHVLPHFEIAVFPHHLHGEHAAHDPLFVAGRLVPLLGILLLAAYVITVAMERVRQSEGDLESAAESAVLERERLEGVIEAAALGLLIVTPAGELLWANPRALEWLGWEGLATGQACPHEHTGGGGCVTCLAADAAHGERRELELGRQPAREESLRYFRHVATPVRGTSGRVEQVLLLVEEVTARKALEAEALHAAKLSALGTMAAGVAHEIGNPLSSLQTRIDLMRRRSHDEPFQRESLGVIERQLLRIAGIVRGISRFAGRREAERQPCSLDELADEAAKLVRLDRRGRGVELRLELAGDLPPVLAVRDHLSQVLLNLLLNGLEAAHGEGSVTLRTAEEDGQVVLAVSDTGPGIDPRVRGRLFTAFASTKADGSGLGLFICQRLIHAHGGAIEVAAAAGKGTTFRVRLPAAAAEQRGAA